MAIASYPKELSSWKHLTNCSRSLLCRAPAVFWRTSRCCTLLGTWCTSTARRTVASASRPIILKLDRSWHTLTDLDRTWHLQCGSGVPQLLLLLDFVRIHVGHWCETSRLSETFTLGQQLTFEGFLAIVLQCFAIYVCNIMWYDVKCFDDTFHVIISLVFIDYILRDVTMFWKSELWQAFGERLRGCVFFYLFFRISDFVKRETENRNFRTWHPEVQSLPRLQMGDSSSHNRLSWWQWMQFGGASCSGSEAAETLVVCVPRLERSSVEFRECSTATWDSPLVESFLLGVRICEQST